MIVIHELFPLTANYSKPIITKALEETGYDFVWFDDWLIINFCDEVEYIQNAFKIGVYVGTIQYEGLNRDRIQLVH